MDCNFVAVSNFSTLCVSSKITSTDSLNLLASKSKVFDLDLRDNEKLGMKNLFLKYKKFANFLELNYGECLIFSPTLFHGNVLNETSITRVSLNCRFKNLFSHEAKN